ncbi:hypothetical protein [Cellulophaga sp. BC115SP]|nr:hypothetical protein [Cellulophaga sp. BC115SP]NBB28610.1 hypothetical protein [Cellulophaga sp. BC115SP]
MNGVRVELHIALNCFSLGINYLYDKLGEYSHLYKIVVNIPKTTIALS